MAITLAAVAGAVAAYFAGVTAVANIAAVYQEYRKTHPRRKATDARGDYVAQHFGRTIKLALPEHAENEFYKGFTDLLPPICQGPTKRGLRSRFLRRVSTGNFSFKSSSPSRPIGTSGRGSRRDQSLLYGDPYVVQKVQTAPDTHSDHFVGLNTGRKPQFGDSQAAEHWESVQLGTACDNIAAPTIAVVNWTTQEITMFIKHTEWGRGMYFRNYQVKNCNLARFAKEFQNMVAFTGIIKDGALVGTSSDIILAEDDPSHSLKSANTWKLLGLSGDTGEEHVFMEMERAALFGLIECLYEDPTLLNVDMLDGGNASGKEFVHVDTPNPIRLQYREDNDMKGSIFSVFAFNALRYCRERVLVG